MYTEQDFHAILSQKKKRWLLIAAVCLPLAALLVYSLIVRNEALTSGTTIVMGVALIFAYDVWIKPVSAYAAYLHGALYGRSHELDCTYLSTDADLSVVENVKYYSMNVQQLDDDGKPFERLLYWDALKPLPDLHQGDHLQITYHDRMVIGLTQI